MSDRLVTPADAALGLYRLDMATRLAGLKLSSLAAATGEASAALASMAEVLAPQEDRPDE